MSAFLLIPLVALLGLGVACGLHQSIFNASTTLRKIFVPLTKQEFWFPPCFLCWGARAAVVAATVILTVQLMH